MLVSLRQTGHWPAILPGARAIHRVKQLSPCGLAYTWPQNGRDYILSKQTCRAYGGHIVAGPVSFRYASLKKFMLAESTDTKSSQLHLSEADV
jgi:predicted alpha/beta-fold hydrolase